MRIVPIILRLRAADTRFKNNIGGSAELDLARRNTLKKDMAFVIPLNEDVAANQNDNEINQTITERFSVIIALANDSSQADKTGIIAYDLLHEVRSQVFRALLGWEIYGSDSMIYYAGGQLLNIHAAYLWYQFDFEYRVRVVGFDGYCDLEGSQLDLEGELREKTQISQLPELKQIYTNYILWPSADLPHEGDLPLDDNYPDVELPDMATIVNIDDDPNPGAFDRGFGSGFDFYRILNRRNDPK